MPFNIGPGELLLILAIALLVIGPGRLPDVGAALGKSLREFRKASTEMQEAVTSATKPTTTAPAAATPTPAVPPVAVASVSAAAPPASPVEAAPVAGEAPSSAPTEAANAPEADAESRPGA
jgi:TatA/E family protein of Tat protein translocase